MNAVVIVIRHLYKRKVKNFTSESYPYHVEIMDRYVIYNSDYHVLICRQHAYGLSPDYIERHFRETHKAIPLETR